MPEGFDLLLRLLIAHLLGDFLLQPRSWVEERKAKHFRSSGLWWHGAVHGVLALLAMGDLRWWPLALVIACTHVAIDILKSYKDTGSAKWFLLDQVLHLAVLVAAWWLIARPDLCSAFGLGWTDPQVLVPLAAFLLVTRPTGFFIAIFTKR